MMPGTDISLGIVVGTFTGPHSKTIQIDFLGWRSDRIEWGQRLFKGTLKRLNRRYHELNTIEVAYNLFGFPHESVHTAGKVLR